MSTQHATAIPPDPVTTAIADAITTRIDLRLLAKYITEELLSAQNIQNQPHNPNDPYPVTEIRRELGSRGRPMAYQTFQKRYIETGLLLLIAGPKRSQLYVARGAWEALKNQTKAK